MKIVTVYSSTMRPDTTGVHVDAALRSLGHEVLHFEPLKATGYRLDFVGYGDLPRGDVVVQVDDDMGYAGPVGQGMKSVYWIIDSHRAEGEFIGGGRRHQKAIGFDHLFVAQKDGERIFPGAKWLPLGYDASQWKPSGPKTTKFADWAFIGNINEPRDRLCRELTARFSRCFWGNAYDATQVALYQRTRLILNLPVRNDINMRFFEAAGVGGLLITRVQNNGERDLIPNLVTYDTPLDLMDVVERWLKDDKGRAELAAEQQAHAQKHHTYQARCRALLEAI